MLRCCCTADAAVGGGELCPSADVRGVSPVARQLWAGASPVPSQISASGKVPAGKVRAAALAPACHSRPSLALPAATNSMRRCVQSRCRCGRDEPSPCADESRGAPSPGADGYQEAGASPYQILVHVREELNSPVAVHATHRRTMTIHRSDAVHARSWVVTGAFSVLTSIMQYTNAAATYYSALGVLAAPPAARPPAAPAPPAPLSAPFGRTAMLPNPASLASDDASAARYTPQRTRASNEALK